MRSRVIFLTLLVGLFFCGRLGYADIPRERTEVENLLGADLSREDIFAMIARFEEQVRKDPENCKAHLYLSFLYDRVGLYRNLVETLRLELEHCATADSDKGVIYGNLAFGYIVLRDLDEAKWALKEALALAPEMPHNHWHSVVYNVLVGDYQKAAEELKWLDDTVAPDQRDVYYDVYLWCLEQEEYKNGDVDLVALFKEGVAQNSKSARPHRMLATVLRDDLENIEDNFDAIIAELESCLKLEPEFYPTYITLANTYMFRGYKTGEKKYYKDAQRWFKKLRKRDPNNAFLPYALGNFYSVKGDHDKAIRHIKAIIKTGDDSEQTLSLLADAYNRKAYSYYKKGRHFEKGLPYIEKALGVEPENAVFLSTKAELLYKMGRFEEAHELIQRAAKINPTYPEIQQDVKMIEEALETHKGDSGF